MNLPSFFFPAIFRLIYRQRQRRAKVARGCSAGRPFGVYEGEGRLGKRFRAGRGGPVNDHSTPAAELGVGNGLSGFPLYCPVVPPR